MANVPKRLIGSSVAVSSTTHYTVPVATTTILKNLVLCNTSATDVKVWLIAGGVNLLFSFNIEPFDTVILDLASVLQTGHTIVTSANATGVHLSVSGVEVA